MKLAEHSEALDAPKALSMARKVIELGPSADWSTRLTTSRNGQPVAVLEFNVSKGGSGVLSIRIKTNREAADAIEKELTN